MNLIPPEHDGLAELAKLRKAASDAIVLSSSPKRLIVAGPGTGKSFTFKQSLIAAGADKEDNPGLALTFIRNLVADLSADLGSIADVFTLHGFCKHLMHQHNVAELGAGDYYPPLVTLLVADLRIAFDILTDEDAVDAKLHMLDDSMGLIGAVLQRADYYRAVSHTDLVYRVLRHFDSHQEAIPSYPLVVVDEFQDFSLLETTFIDLLSRRSSMLVAGDDDQALYSSLKHASPTFIRELAEGPDYQRFELPYCSRCTEVIVAAVNTIIARAVSQGRLQKRLSKTFKCYLPDKRADSAANPKILHVNCSTANEPYVGQYISQQIGRIPTEDIHTSRASGYPTALVIGPQPFLRRAYEIVRQRFPSARMRTSPKPQVDVLDGYRRLALNADSRLGWRIVIDCHPYQDWEEALRDALTTGKELSSQLPEPYREEHIALAQLVGHMLRGQKLASLDGARLSSATGRSLQEIEVFLGGPASEDAVAADADDADESLPDILFTSLVGSKGLSAHHVFIVGLNNKHFPRDATAITDDEVCSLLVALSRTRKRCHMISCKFFGDRYLESSVFLSWLKGHLERIEVNAKYDFAN